MIILALFDSKTNPMVKANFFAACSDWIDLKPHSVMENYRSWRQMISAIQKENKTQVTHFLEDLFQIFNARAREISSPDRVQLETCHDIPTHARCTTDVHLQITCSDHLKNSSFPPSPAQSELDTLVHEISSHIILS